MKTRENEDKATQWDVIAWLHGCYVAEAINSTVGNMFRKGTPAKYPSQPRSSEKVATKTEDNLLMQNYHDMMAWSQAFNARK